VVIPALHRGESVNFAAQMYLDNHPPIAGGREIWGFPKELGHPKLQVVHDTLTGTLDYAAFPAVMIDGQPYWDGGVYSNTPIEVVMDDDPRRDSVIFSTRLWQQEDETPQSLARVMSRLKEVQYSSRAGSHTARQQQIHHLRHIVRELGRRLPEAVRAQKEVKQLLGWGCGSVMHVLTLRAPALDNEDHSKDLDFTPAGIAARWTAGREFARRMIAAAPWEQVVDPMAGIVVHE
jgi:NTE family protein